ncbi:nucleotidyltransferase family protein [Actinoplanes sp. NPDC049265]|uniref:nucleotidyltransferase family protein n=1 Tax=Actinoplanes sp. NPDC049265 TaxID=3363902 RepID=UPI003719A167
MATSEERLTAVVTSSRWMTNVLDTVARSGLPDAWVAAGLLRDLVWGELFGPGFDPAGVRDVDVVYFDPVHLERRDDDEATAALTELWDGPPWEAKNQAAVHLWYHVKFGGHPRPPYRSIADAVATFPEYATAVAVRRTAARALEICAPHGLDDLLAGVWRRNPARVDVPRSRERLARQCPAARFRGVTVIEP